MHLCRRREQVLFFFIWICEGNLCGNYIYDAAVGDDDDDDDDNDDKNYMMK